MSEPTRAILYAAKSTEDKHGSIPDQLADGRRLASARGLEVVAEHQDEAMSAYSGDRGPGLARAMADCERLAGEHGTCALIVQHSDRLARGDAKQARHLIEVVLWALKANVQLLSVQDREMLAGGDLALLLGAIGGMRNHQDSKRKGAAVKGGIRRRAVERGQYVGGRRPYGYRHRDTTPDGENTGPLVIVDAEAAIVRRIYAAYLAGMSQRQIAIDLNDDQVLTLTGTHWYATTVAGMLRNPLYMGWITHNGESFPAQSRDGAPAHEPIIDPDTWERARQLRDSLAQAPGRGRGRRTRGSHVFTDGLLRCGCGTPMSPVTKPTRTPGTLYEVYTCARRLHHGVNACAQPPVKRELIDTAVWRYFERVALDVDATRAAIEARAAQQLSEHDALRREAEQELTRVEESYRRIEGDYMSGALTVAQWARFEAKLNEQIDAARGQAEQHERQRRAIEATVADFDGEAAMFEELATIRRLVAGEAQAGSRDGLESFRQALRRLFVGFELLSPARPFGSGALSGQGPVWTAQNEDGATKLGVEGGYALLPVVRPEAVDREGVDLEGFPALRRATLPFRDNFHSRLAAW